MNHVATHQIPTYLELNSLVPVVVHMTKLILTEKTLGEWLLAKHFSLVREGESSAAKRFQWICLVANSSGRSRTMYLAAAALKGISEEHRWYSN